jgi:putative transposase
VNNIPYSESIFKKMKYQPTYPQRPFENLLAARQWIGTFVHWYNEDHRHIVIGFVKPARCHVGLDNGLSSTKPLRQGTPKRWSRARETGSRLRLCT